MIKRAHNNFYKLIWHSRGMATDVNRQYHKFVSGHSEGTNVMAEDWDTLILLDACRYDMFAEEQDNTVWLNGKLESRRSLGTDSSEFIQHNFSGEKLHDTVYVTANPYSAALDKDTFHKVISLIDSEWDDDLGTVHPDVVLEAAIQAHTDYPDKRIIVHFMQPHGPFLTEFGKLISKELAHCRGLWAPEPSVSRRDLKRAYRENLQYVLPRVETLLTEIEGRAVISADHGELLGERQWPIPVRGYEHKRNLYLPVLQKVPWCIFDSGPRRKTVSEKPATETAVNQGVAEERLEALGYVEKI